MNALEKLYYGTVGKVFNPYITTPGTDFDVRRLRRVTEKMDGKLTDIPFNLIQLIKYAIARDFKPAF